MMTKEEFEQALRDNENSYFEKNSEVLNEYALDIGIPFYYIDELEDYLASFCDYLEVFKLGRYSDRFNYTWDIFAEDPYTGLISYPQLIDFVKEEIDANDFFEWLENN